MKEKDVRRLISYADEEYIKEAEPPASGRKKKAATPPWLRPVALAASFLLLFSVGITLFFSLRNTDYTDSAYYPVIAEINAYREKNGASDSSFFDLLFGTKKGDGSASAPGAAGSDSTPEITDHQVAGVKEANRIARTDSHIFYLDGVTLRAYSVAEEESAEVGSLALAVENSRYLKSRQAEFFLSEEGDTVTVLLPYTDKDRESRVSLLTIDVSDPKEMREIGHVSVSGSYLTSRKVGGDLFLITEYRPDAGMDFRKEETFLPGLWEDGDFSPVSPDKILLPEDGITSLSYTVVTRMFSSEEEPEVAAFLSYSDDLYVSATRIYATRAHYRTTEIADGTEIRVLKSEIARIRYADGAMTPEPSIETDGQVTDRFCLDEADGILRVVTTVNRTAVGGTDLSEVGTSASLFCYSLDNGSCVAKVERFAPVGETVRSARFDGDRLAVCTSIRNTDPVFLFDLSDLSDITEKDTGTIDGFSTSLIPFGDCLIGIGEGDERGSLKIEAYEETENAVRSLSSYVLKNTSYASEYKAYAVDRASSVLGLGAEDVGGTHYLVFYFDGKDLFLAENIPLAGDPAVQRGCLVGDWFYAFGESDFAVRRIFGE